MQEKNDVDSGVVANFNQGEYANKHPLFGLDNSALQLLFYYDGFEVVNPLGSKINGHHMGKLFMFGLMA